MFRRLKGRVFGLALMASVLFFPLACASPSLAIDSEGLGQVDSVATTTQTPVASNSPSVSNDAATPTVATPDAAASATTPDATASATTPDATASESGTSEQTGKVDEKTSQDVSDDTGTVAGESQSGLQTTTTEGVATATPADGLYNVESALREGTVLDVADGSTGDGANVQVFQSNGTNAQKFQLSLGSDGYYTITNFGSGKTLDVEGASTLSGANVQQYQSNGTAAQKWKLVDAGNGYYSLVSLCSGLCLDVAYGSVSSGTNVWTCTANGTDSQRFRFLTVVSAVNPFHMEDGAYVISSSVDNGMVLDIAGGSVMNCANLQLFKSNGTAAQTFIITDRDNGYYSITCAQSGLVLDVAFQGHVDGTNVWQCAWNGSAAQLWRFVESAAGNGSFYVVSACNDLCLDITYGLICDGTNLQVCGSNKTAAQEFCFTATELTPLISDGTYTIASRLNYDRVIDLAYGSADDGANIQLSANNYTRAQKFVFTYDGTGSYTIMSVLSGKYLDVSYASQIPGTNVWQYTGNDSSAQLWEVLSAGDGSYYLRSRCNGLYLDIAGACWASGTNVQVYSANESAAQRFIIESNRAIEECTCTNTTALGDIYVIDIPDASTQTGVRPTLYTENDSLAQQFVIIRQDDGSYTVVSRCSGLAMDVLYRGTESGTPIQQWTLNDTDAQRWNIEETSDGFYVFSAVASGLFLSVQGGRAVDKAALVIATADYSQAQKFSLRKKVASVSDGLVVDISAYDGDIDWSVASNYISIAILRAQHKIGSEDSDGDQACYSNGKDYNYDQNASGCEVYGIPYGAYSFASYVSVGGAIQEACDFWTYTHEDGHKPYFYVVDVERNVPESQAQELTSAFISELRSLAVSSGEGLIKVGIYIAHHHYEDYNLNLDEADFIWIPRYGGYSPDYPYDIWQYGPSIISGIDGEVDTNTIVSDGPNQRSIEWYAET